MGPAQSEPVIERSASFKAAVDDTAVRIDSAISFETSFEI